MPEEKDDVKAGWEPSFIKLRELEVVWKKNVKNADSELNPSNLEYMIREFNQRTEEVFKLETTWKYAVDVLGVRGDAADLTPEHLVRFCHEWCLMHKALQDVAKLINEAREIL